MKNFNIWYILVHIKHFIKIYEVYNSVDSVELVLRITRVLLFTYLDFLYCIVYDRWNIRQI
jgi:hypothetical protein